MKPIRHDGVNMKNDCISISSIYSSSRLPDAPGDSACAVAQALDEHRDLFQVQLEPWRYDPQTVAVSSVVRAHSGALKYYRERGYVKWIAPCPAHLQAELWGRETAAHCSILMIELAPCAV
jgi:hypothetical protein